MLNLVMLFFCFRLEKIMTIEGNNNNGRKTNFRTILMKIQLKITNNKTLLKY